MSVRYKVETKRKGYDRCVVASAWTGRRKIGNVVACESLRYYDVNRAGVAEGYQRQRIGTRLYELAAQEACKNGKPMRSQHYAASGMARSFWRKQVRKGRAETDGESTWLSCPAPASLGSFRNAPKGWFRRPAPRTRQVCYRTKADALNVLREHNQGVIDAHSGIDFKHRPADFDAINHKYDLRGRQRATTIAEAFWESLRGGPPYCLDEVDLEALRETLPRLELPDFVHEARWEREAWEHYRSVAPAAESAEEMAFVPFGRPRRQKH